MASMNRDLHPSRALSRRGLLRRAGAIAAVCSVPALTACTMLDARADERYTIEMTSNMRFEPAGLTIPVGGTVVWRNTSQRRHTSTTDEEVVDAPGMIALPPGAEPWHSGDLLDGEIFTHTFTVPGSYVFVCQHHVDNGMVGTITVEDTGGESS